MVKPFLQCINARSKIKLNRTRAYVLVTRLTYKYTKYTAQFIVQAVDIMTMNNY